MALFNYAPRCNGRTVTGPAGVTVRVVQRLTLAFPAAWSAVAYFHKYSNLANETPDLERDMHWDRVSEWSIAANNQYCLDRLAQTAKHYAEDQVYGDAKIVKIELYDADTHKLLATA